jgi:hypothetical protein
VNEPVSIAPARVVFSIDSMRVCGTEPNAVRRAELLARRVADVRLVALNGVDPMGERAGIPVGYCSLPSLGSTAFFLAKWLRGEEVDRNADAILKSVLELCGADLTVSSQNRIAGHANAS